MNVLVVSCNHHNAGVRIREKLAFSSEDQLSAAYARWREEHPNSEIVVLSTCNRVEIYAADESEDSRVSFDDITRFISRFHNIPTDDFVQSVLAHHGPRAVSHLFEVTCSIDSMVLGETADRQSGQGSLPGCSGKRCLRPLTNVLFQQALSVPRESERRLGWQK